MREHDHEIVVAIVDRWQSCMLEFARAQPDAKPVHLLAAMIHLAASGAVVSGLDEESFVAACLKTYRETIARDEVGEA